MLSKLYLETTNPKLHLSQMFNYTILIPMIISIIFHTIIYILFCNMVSYIFLDKILSSKINKKLLFFLILIMFFGFFGRFYHVKDIYKAYNGNMEKTRNHLDKLYITWIFVS
jgi:H+/Cl- antiporter ClcA